MALLIKAQAAPDVCGWLEACSRRGVQGAAAAEGLRPSTYVRRKLGLELDSAGDIVQEHVVDVQPLINDN